MHSLIGKLLKKRGIKDINDLDKEEKTQLKNWDLILSKKDVSVKDIKDFCRREIGRIEDKWEKEEDAKLIPYHVVYRKIINVISDERAKQDRENMEQYLTNLIK